MNVEIIRVEQGQDGTFGVLKVDGKCICLTLERPWEDNKPNVSCIPVGVYQCKRISSPKYGGVFEVQDVPGRSHILIHNGNTIKDTQGCILLGMFFGQKYEYHENLRCIFNSRYAFELFMERLEGVNELTLTILEAL